MRFSVLVWPSTTPGSYDSHGSSQFSGETHMTAKSARRSALFNWSSNHVSVPPLILSDIQVSTVGMTSLSQLASFSATSFLLHPDHPMNTGNGIRFLLV